MQSMFWYFSHWIFLLHLLFACSYWTHFEAFNTSIEFLFRRRTKGFFQCHSESWIFCSWKSISKQSIFLWTTGIRLVCHTKIATSGANRLTVKLMKWCACVYVNEWQSVGEIILCGRHRCDISLCMWLFSFCSQRANRISLVFISPFIYFLTLYGCLLWSPITIAAHTALSKQFQVIQCVNSSCAHCLCHDYAFNSATKCACTTDNFICSGLAFDLARALSVRLCCVRFVERKKMFYFGVISYTEQLWIANTVFVFVFCVVVVAFVVVVVIARRRRRLRRQSFHPLRSQLSTEYELNCCGYYWVQFLGLRDA